MSDPVLLGQAVLDEIIKQGMVRAEFVNPDGTIYIWNGNAAEQIGCRVLEFLQNNPLAPDIQDW